MLSQIPVVEFQYFSPAFLIEGLCQILDDVFVGVVWKARGQRARAAMIQDADDLHVAENSCEDWFIGYRRTKPRQNRQKIRAENLADEVAGTRAD